MSVTPYVAPPQTTPWVPLWPLGGQTLGELAYWELPSPTSVTGSVEASAVIIVTAPAVMLDGATPIVVEFQCPGLTAPAGQALYLWLFDNGVSIGRIGSTGNGGANPGGTGVRVARRLIPSAGSHAYSIRATMSGGTGSVDAGPGGISATMPAFIRVSLASPISNAPAGAVLPVQYGTSLPVGPVDGQEAILVDSLTAPAYQWRFRYNALATGANKWEFVGGAPFAPAPQTVAIATSYTSIPGSITIPRSGDYLAAISGYFSAGTSANIAVGVVGDEAAKLISVGYVGTGSGVPWASGQAVFTYTAGNVVLMRALSSVATNLNKAGFSLTPLRVA